MRFRPPSPGGNAPAPAAWIAWWLILLVACGVATPAPVRAGPEVRKMRVECPVCEDVFSFRFRIQEFRTGLRLDFKEFGSVDTPAPLPECRRCGFVFPDGARGELEESDVERLRVLVRSDRFAIARGETSYFRLASILEALGRPPQDIAFAYVAASWQVDEEPVRCQIYLARALAWYDNYLARPEPASPARTRAMLLRVEILRRLGRFMEATAYLDEIVHHPAMARQNEQNVLQQQRDLVGERDDEPHVAIADDARVDVALSVVTPGVRSLRPQLTPSTRLPTFPSGPYAARVAGTVTVRLNVTRSGYVVGWEVRSATAAVFAQSVLRSVRDWTFDPERLDGAPSPVQIECTVRFGLEG